MKVLIVKTSALGDIVHALPVLAWLKSAQPGLQIDWLAEDAFAPLLEGHPLLRNVHRIATRAWRRQGWPSTLKQGAGVISALRREHYDLVLDLQGNSKSGLFTAFCGAPRRFGFDRGGVREWPNLLATNRRVALSADDHHISDRALAVARAAFPGGSEAPAAGPLPVQAEASRTIDRLAEENGLAGRRFAVLHYGTTWVTKLWAVGNWQTLVRHLAEQTDLVPVLTWGSAEERAVVERIAAAAGESAVIWPRGSLVELVALLARAAVVIGGDTGPVHIAAATGTPTVSIYRVTDALRNGPRGSRHVCLQVPLDCSPCLRKSCERDQECGSGVSPGAVISALSELLGGEGACMGSPR